MSKYDARKIQERDPMTPRQLPLPAGLSVPPHLRVDASVTVVDTDWRRDKADRDARERAEQVRQHIKDRDRGTYDHTPH